jgi:hypothetical protein
MILMFQSFSLYSNEVAIDYISQYKNIAIQEMNRTGIPASIKLGQAILESNMGRSQLATVAKNHFGIKCGSTWNGDTYYLKDDDRDRAGRLVKSCFRTFDSVVESFIAHSEFLLGSKSGRYNFLFNYEIDDYKAWAHGLRRAGYATDKKYPQKLINVIEKYGLQKYDEYYDDGMILVFESRKEENKEEIDRLKTRNAIVADNTYNVRSYAIVNRNRVSFAKAIGGETLKEMAQALGLKVTDLMKYNENHGYASLELLADEPIYIKSKKRTYQGSEEYHIVGEDEDMYYISQLYGIKLQNLYAKNKMPKESQPLVGEKLYLKQTVPKGERPKYLKRGEIRDEEIEFLFADENKD